MKKTWVFLAFLPAAMALGFVAACGDDDDDHSQHTTGGDGGTDANKPDSPGVDSSQPDTGQPDAQPETLSPTILAQFNAAVGERPEGVVIQSGTPIVGFAPLGKLVRVLGDGGTEAFGDLSSFGTTAMTFTTGLVLDTSNNVYAGVARVGATPVPAPGIYKFPAAGGDGVRFDTAADGTWAIPNGLWFVGTDLFVGDSGKGSIMKVAPDGSTTVWKTDPELAGDKAACNSPKPVPLGVNGIVADASYVYGNNTDKGTFFRIKIEAGGAAGNVEVLYKNCDYAGADGIAIDTDGTFIVANSFPKSRIDRVTISGSTATWKTIGTGKPPYDRPGSVVIDGTGAAKKLWFTNTSFDVDVDAAAPGLGSAPLK